MTTTKNDLQMEEVQSWDDVPVFASEDEERAYWDTHTLSDALLNEMAEGPGDPRLPAPRGHGQTRPVSMRLDDDLLQRLKAAARRRNMRYQTLLKQWLSERIRLEESLSAQGTAMFGGPPFDIAIQGDPSDESPSSLYLRRNSYLRSINAQIPGTWVGAYSIPSPETAIADAARRAQQAIEELALLAAEAQARAAGRR